MKGLVSIIDIRPQTVNANYATLLEVRGIIERLILGNTITLMVGGKGLEPLTSCV